MCDKYLGVQHRLQNGNIGRLQLGWPFISILAVLLMLLSLASSKPPSNIGKQHVPCACLCFCCMRYLSLWAPNHVDSSTAAWHHEDMDVQDNPEARAALQKLLQGSIQCIEFTGQQILIDQPRAGLAYMAGSFNPLHDGHRFVEGASCAPQTLCPFDDRATCKGIACIFTSRTSFAKKTSRPCPPHSVTAVMWSQLVNHSKG